MGLMRKLIILFFPLLIFSLFPNQVLAKIGVGVGIGKIQVDEKLKPGIIYQLPSFTVLNTGDEASDYEVSIEYHEKQPQLRPPQTWFIFSPQKFYLEPGGVQQVDVKLNLPLRIEPGDYFAYLEAHPNRKSQQGETRVGVAAAAKLYFTVEPANFLLGIYYKIVSFFNVYAPWPQRVVIGLLIIGLLIVFKKFFNVQINLKKPGKKSFSTDKQDE
jgi:hypothetical protein